MTTTCAIYTRISDDKEGDGAGVDRQEQDCRRLAADLGYTVLAVFSDNDVSASTRSRKRRPSYEEMMGRAEAGEFGAILAYTASRLTRRPLDYERLINLSDQRGTVIRTVKSGQVDLATADGKMLARILAGVDAAEADRISERASRKHRELAESGLYDGGGRPFGYQKSGPKKARTLVPDPAEAALVQEAARRVLEGEPMRAIVRDWRERKITTVNGRRWEQANLRRVLLSPRNIGVREYRPANRAGVRPSFGEGEMYADAWDAILTRDVWDALRVVLSDPDRCTNGGRVEISHLLSGFCRCGRCGARMRSGQLGAGDDRTRKYVCPPAPHGCCGVARLAEPVEDLVTDRVFHWLDSGLYESAVAAAESDGEYRDLLVRRREVQERLSRIETDYADGAIDAAEMRAAKARNGPALEAIERDIARRQASRLVPSGVGIRTAWQTWTLARRRDVLAVLVDRVVVFPTLVGAKRFDPRKVQIIPGAWATGLDESSLAVPVSMEPRQLRGQELRDALLAYLADRGTDASPTEVARALTLDLSTVVKVLKRLTDMGVVVRTRPWSGREPSRYAAA